MKVSYERQIFNFIENVNSNNQWIFTGEKKQHHTHKKGNFVYIYM